VKKRLLIAAVLAIVALVLLVPTAMAAQPAGWPAVTQLENPNLTKYLTPLLKQANDFDPVNAVNNGIYIAAKTDKYFQGGVEVGLEALLEAGRVYVNGIRVPADPANYYMNGMPAIWKQANGDWTWQAHDKLNTDKLGPTPLHSFEFARRMFVLAVSGLRGMTTTIYALPGKTLAYQVNFSIKSAGQAEKIVVNRWGTNTVYGVPVDATSYKTDGGPNRWEARTIRWANFDWNIKAGDVVLYWFDRTGWHMQRCATVTGLMTAANTDNITVLGVTRSDALIVRYNMQAGSRPGQVVREANNLHLGNIPVVLWNTDTGHVVGITHGKYARTALYAALAYVNAQIQGKQVVVSVDGTDVFSGKYWVTQAVMDAYNAALAAANAQVFNWWATFAQMDAVTEALGAAWGDGTKGMSAMQHGSKEEISYVTLITDGTSKITGTANNQYFGGNAATGVQALLDAGKVFVNGLKVPATEGETTLYSMNAIDALWWNAAQSTWGFAVHKYCFNYGPASPPAPALGGVTYSPKTFNQARLEMVENLSQRRGRTVKLTIDAATGQAIRIDLQELETVYIGAIETHGATTTINRSAYTLETGRYPIRFDVNGIFFDTSTVDLTVGVGDFAVWWLSPDGWHLKRCIPVTGTLTKDGSGYYHIGTDVRYEADCSRFNLATSVRPTQFYTSYVRLGLTGFTATAWCTPDTGSPIGFTYGSDLNAKNALTLAITNATAAKADVYVSAAGDGSDVPAASGTKWVTTAVNTTYDAALATAAAVLAAPTSVGISYTAAIYDLANALGQGTAPKSGYLGSINVKP
jgi:hypothetical protein